MHSARSTKNPAGSRSTRADTLWSPAVPSGTVNGLQHLDVALGHTTGTDLPLPTGAGTSSLIEHGLHDDDVQISLGLPSSIGKAWNLGLRWVGSLSLARQDEYAVTQDDSLDTASVFGRGNRAKEASQPVRQSSQADTGGRSRSTTNQSNSSNKTVRSDEFAAVRAKHLTRQLSRVLEESRMDGGVSDNTAGEHSRLRRKRDPHRKKRDRHKSDRKHREPVDGVDSRPATGHERSRRPRKHRSSMRPGKLLLTPNPQSAIQDTSALPQPAQPQSLSGDTIAPTMLYLPQAERKHSDISKQLQAKLRPRAMHSRSKSQPLPDTAELPATNGSARPPAFRPAVSATMTAAKLMTEEEYMAMLEEQVSGMFVDLGLRSPYLNSAHNRPRLPSEGRKSASCACEEPLWFRSGEYSSGSTPLGCHHGRYIVLIDDDSSYSE
ncbi:hypothetical protein H4R23_000461 [Coemansia sp. Cherry 401B]|nr:hypothetical protein IWW54_003849 [Coemansia sp. RSA 2705]KAJ2739445.1 hypothetical protein H4R23_000461 [Coemansia sp. Cherry 401B]